MVRWLNWRTILGALLIVFGGLALLQALGYLGPNDQFISSLVALAFLGGGLAFLSVMIRDRRQWWPAIPGLVLVSLALMIAYSTFFPNAPQSYAGAFFLGGLSLAFWVVYIMDRRQWWAVIPGGVLLTLAFISALGESGVAETGGAFFFGLGLTFVIVAILPNMGHSLRWAWIPAGVLLVMGALLSLSANNLINYVWPVALILVGGYMVFRAFRRQA